MSTWLQLMPSLGKDLIVSFWTPAIFASTLCNSPFLKNGVFASDLPSPRTSTPTPSLQSDSSSRPTENLTVANFLATSKIVVEEACVPIPFIKL